MNTSSTAFCLASSARITLAILLLAALSAWAAGQGVPQNITATAPTATSIQLTWDDVPDDESYRIERDGVVIANVPQNQTHFTDNGLTTGTTYVYRVGNVSGGNVAWSAKAWALPTTQTEFWVVDGLAANERRVGYTYCEYFQRYPANTNYHFGVDVMRVGNDATGKKTVVAPFSGRIRNFVVLNGDQNLAVRISNGEHYLLAHLQNSVMGAGDIGGWVMAGARVAEVLNNDFGVYGAHVHCNRDVQPYNFANPVATNMRHFLELYSAGSSLRDPTGAAPQVLNPTKPDTIDPNADPILFKADGAGGAYFTAKTPVNPPPPQKAQIFIVKGKVDIVAGAQDPMGHPVKPAAVFSIGYWIEARRRFAHDVMSQGRPYVLHRCSPHLFNGNQPLTNDIYETTQKTVVWNTWTNCYHYVVTNTKGIDGSMANVDASQHWATKAKNVAGGEANGVGKGDATKASEAYFPDGPYEVFVRVSDLNTTVVISPSSHTHVWVENFPPAVADHFGVLDTAPSGEQVCAVAVRFSEPMNRSSVELATKVFDDLDNEVPVVAKWSNDSMEVTFVPNSFAGYRYRVFIDAGIAKDLSGGPNGTGAFLDSAFGLPQHNGVSEGSGKDSYRFEVHCGG